MSVVLALKPRFFCQNLVFEKSPFLCPFFGNTDWTKMVHTVVSQLKQNPPQKRWKHYFSAGIWFLLQSNKPVLASGWWKHNKFFCAHWCFFGAKMFLFTISAGFWGFRSWVVNPFFLLLAFVFWCSFFWFLVYFFLLLLLYQVSMFWLLFLLFFWFHYLLSFGFVLLYFLCLATSLGPKPSLLVFFFQEKNLFFPLRKGSFACFWMSPFVSF